jgi:LacI family transcriptional regulator
LGIKVPGDLGVVGFDDIDIADYMGLTTVKQQLHGSGKEAALLVNKLIKDPLMSEPREIFLPLELIIRRST